MLILPAIDLRGGQCVRLRQGDYAQETVFGDDPAAMARRWVGEGADRLHLVDLDGAKRGPAGQRRRHPPHRRRRRTSRASSAAACAPRPTSRRRSSWGVARVILGTGALQDPAWVRQHGRSATPAGSSSGIDARDGKVATDGWLNTSEASRPGPGPRVRRLAAGRHRLHRHRPRRHARAARTSTALAELAGAVAAAGDRVRRRHHPATTCRDLARPGLPGCIIGRALYEGQIDLSAVIELFNPGSFEGVTRVQCSRCR